MRTGTTRTILTTLLALLLLAALAGCDGLTGVFGAATPTPAATTAAPTVEITPSPSPTPTPSPTPVPTPTPTPVPTPNPDAQYYSDKETVELNEKEGHWVYKSPTLGVEVKRVTQTKPTKLNYYVANIHTRDPKLLQSFYAGDDHTGKVRLVPEKIAAKTKCVIAVTADFFNNPYTSDKNKKGIIIRDGKLKSDAKSADSLAILPDGTFKIYSPKEIAPQKLIDMGVQTCYSFGPGLVRDGAIAPNLKKHALARRNPRTGVGMVKPGHYIFIVVDGREPKLSVGVTFDEFAQMFLDYGCTQAYNFDGGQSASMCFMGKQLNVMHVQSNGFTQRRMPDLFGLGTSELAK